MSRPTRYLTQTVAPGSSALSGHRGAEAGVEDKNPSLTLVDGTATQETVDPSSRRDWLSKNQAKNVGKVTRFACHHC